MSIGWIEKSSNFGITYRSAKASASKPPSPQSLTFENARRSITKRYNGAVYYLNNEKPSNGIAARRGGVLPRTLLIFPAVVSLYVEISQRRKPAHNAVAIQPRSDAGALSSIDHPADECSARASWNDRYALPLPGTVRLISPSRFAKCLHLYYRPLRKLGAETTDSPGKLCRERKKLLAIVYYKNCYK